MDFFLGHSVWFGSNVLWWIPWRQSPNYSSVMLYTFFSRTLMFSWRSITHFGPAPGPNTIIHSTDVITDFFRRTLLDAYLEPLHALTGPHAYPTLCNNRSTYPICLLSSVFLLSSSISRLQSYVSPSPVFRLLYFIYRPRFIYHPRFIYRLLSSSSIFHLSSCIFHLLSSVYQFVFRLLFFRRPSSVSVFCIPSSLSHLSYYFYRLTSSILLCTYIFLLMS